MPPTYEVYILNSARERVKQVKALIQIDRRGNVLKYGKQLSGPGFCRLRIARQDPLWGEFGDIADSWRYGVQIVRDKRTVWQGIIINNPHRTRNYIDVEGRGYMYRWRKIRIKHDPESKPGDGLDNYRTFKSGTMAAAITAVFNESKTVAGSGDILAGFQIGTIENPNFPGYFLTPDNKPLTGPWTFSEDLPLQFNYTDVLTVYQSFGIYSNCDFEVRDNLTFNFRKRIGNKQPGLVFKFGERGNILDYDAPRSGERQVNDMMGIAADIEGNVLHIPQIDQPSIDEYGRLQGSQGFLDVKEPNPLRVRLAEELRFVSRPDTAINIVLSEKAYPLGKWDIGDTATILIEDNPININEERRITGYSVQVHNTMREVTTVETNRDREI